SGVRFAAGNASVRQPAHSEVQDGGCGPNAVTLPFAVKSNVQQHLADRPGSELKVADGTLDRLLLGFLESNAEVGKEQPAVYSPFSDTGLGRRSSIGPFRQKSRNHLLLRSEEHTSEPQSRVDIVCRLL